MEAAAEAMEALVFPTPVANDWEGLTGGGDEASVEGPVLVSGLK